MMHAKPTLRRHLIEELRRQFDGDPWHGSSLWDILRGITAEQAAHRVGSAHTIQELVLHLAGWTREVTSRITGAEAGDPPKGDWPRASGASDKTWMASKRRLRQAQGALLAVLEELPDARLHRPVLDHRPSSGETGKTVAETVSGLIQHDVYHAGQTSLLKKLVQK